MRRPRRLVASVVASAALHALALLLATHVDWRVPAPEPPLVVRVVPLAPRVPDRRAPARPPEPSVRPDSAQPAERRSPPDATDRRPAEARPQPTPRPTPTPPPAVRPDGQVVDLPNRPRPGERRERPPADTPYLGERDRTVEREAVARAQPTGRPGLPAGPGEGPERPRAEERRAPPSEPSAPTRPAEPTGGARPEPAPQAPTREAARRAAPAREAPSAVARPTAPSTRPEAPPAPPRPDAPRDALPAPAPRTAARASRPGAGPDDRPDDDAPEPRHLPRLDRLLPGPERLARLSPTPDGREPGGGGGRVRDYLPGVEEGEETYLNTREFRYAYYFNHVKRAIAQNWDPGGAIGRAYPGGLAATGEAMTAVLLVIGKGGEISRLELVRGSGIEVLDSEAIRAVRAAHRFPAPPAGLLDPDGTLYYPIGFIVTMGGGGRLTVYGRPDEGPLGVFRDPFGRGRRPAPSR